MIRIDKTAIVPYLDHEMYAIVNDVEKYPDFLPWCQATTVLELHESSMTATIEVSKKGITRAFTTHNTLRAPESIKIALVDGPFRVFDSEWQFKALGQKGCQVHYHMAFEFNKGWINAIIEPMFEKICHAMISAFIDRAETLYGKR